MKPAEYAACDALGLAELVARGEVAPKELAAAAVASIEKADPVIRAVVELYPDRIEGLEGYPDYVRCVETGTGERLYFLWSDMEEILATGGHASADWVSGHRLPDEWFGTDGYPVEGAFG